MKMNRLELLSLLIIMQVAIPAYSSVSKNDTLEILSSFNISSWYHHGYLFPHYPSIRFYNTDNINGFELFVSKYYPEMRHHRSTEIGAGYYYSNLGNRDIYGRVHGLYTAIGTDFLRERFPVYIQQTTAFGISYNTKRFDIQDNPFNRPVGSHLNAYIELSVILRAEIAEHLIVSAGPTLVHMSNGNIEKPNLGMNLVNTKIGLTYEINAPYPLMNKKALAPNEFSKNSFQMILSGSIRKLSRKVPEIYLVATLVADYSRRINRYQALGAGMDIVYDHTQGSETIVIQDRLDEIVPWHIGAHLTWERFWNRFSIVLQPGYKILTFSKQEFYQYNRIGVRYCIKDVIILNWSVKTHRFSADFVEFGIGYSLQ